MIFFITITRLIKSFLELDNSFLFTIVIEQEFSNFS